MKGNLQFFLYIQCWVCYLSEVGCMVLLILLAFFIHLIRRKIEGKNKMSFWGCRDLGKRVCVCFRGAREQKEVSDYLPPPLPLMLSAGFISPLHFQIKFVLRMGEQWGMFVCVGVVCVCVCWWGVSGCLLCSIRAMGPQKSQVGYGRWRARCNQIGVGLDRCSLCVWVCGWVGQVVVNPYKHSVSPVVPSGWNKCTLPVCWTRPLTEDWFVSGVSWQRSGRSADDRKNLPAGKPWTLSVTTSVRYSTH